MSIECPYCQFVIKLKGVKAGRYSPRCPKCGKAFTLTVSGAEDSYQFTAKAAEAKPPAAAFPAPSKPAPAPKANPAKPAGPKAAAPVPKAPAPPRAPEPLAPPPANEEKPAAPPRMNDPDVTAAAFIAEEEDPDTTGGYLPQPGKADAEGVAFAETEFAGGSEPDGMEGTRVVEDLTGDDGFDVDSSAEKPAEDEEDEKPRKKKKKADDEEDIPKTLGGYEVLDQLGKGGMGTVYLARQVSLDRPVALKVMNPRWASDPVFVARFTREAYAAAQLVHHNVVQIYDIGQDKGVNYFSMEFVKGTTLFDLVKKETKLDVDVAVGYILQAARGLKAAHDQGMVHRDVKPDNLMLNGLGVVKVADLGLVKTPGSAEPGADGAGEEGAAHDKERKKKASLGSLSSMPSVTNVGSAMGTPTYMAPEQGMNAATVDHRADIYSLGCTLYVLLTGRTPFRGKTALEVMTKHLTEAPVPPEQIAKRVPPEVSAIVMKMMAKKPENRQADMSEVIAELEKFLGVSQVGPFSPSEEHADALEECVKSFNGAPSAKLRALAAPAFYGGCVLLAVLCCFFSLRLAGGILGLGLMTAVISFLVRGVTEKTYLFSKVREFIAGSGPRDWLMWGATAILVLAVLYMMGLLTYWLAFLVLSGLAAGGMRVLIDKPLARQRKEPIEKAEKLLRSLRLKGLSEESVRQFVCKYSGLHWEEFYEALFGYEALLVARKLWSRPEGGKPRPTHAAWRDPVVQWIGARQRARKEARERKHLQEIERKKLQAEGVSAGEAKTRSAETAAVMVSAAAEIKQQAEQRAVADDAALMETSAAPVAVNARMLMEAAEKPKSLPPEIKKKLEEKPRVNPLALVFGGTVRFIVGAVLVTFCFLWVNQNELTDQPDTDSYLAKIDTAAPLAFLPAPLDNALSGLHVGLAGVLLVLSMLMRSKRLLFFVLLAATALLVLPMVLPADLGVKPTYVALIAGFALAEFGAVFNRAARPKV